MSVDVRTRNRLVIITIDRPEKRNALDAATNEGLREAFEHFADNEDLWVAIVAGRGPDFCAGADLRAPARGRGHVRPGGITRGYQCWKPIIAALHGNVLGGGLELALCADLRVADETARLASPEVRWGLMQGAGATQRLPRAIPFGVALEMLMTGDPIDALRAERLGLVNRVVPAGKALDAAIELAERICERAPLGVRRAKEAAYRGWDQTLAEGLRTEELLSRLLARTADLEEGAQAFSESRRAVWQGR